MPDIGGYEDITLKVALVLAIVAETGAIVWLAAKLLKSKENRIGDEKSTKDVLLKIIKDNTDSNNNLVNAINNQVKAADKASDILNDLQRDILRATIKNKKNR